MRLVIRDSADKEITNGLVHYLSQAGDKVASDFLDKFKAGLAHIAAFPESGATRYRSLFPEIDLRFWRIKTFPYLIFYIIRGDHVDVIAVLHAFSDIPNILAEKDAE
jgi:toxin ParE1/3/4